MGSDFDKGKALAILERISKLYGSEIKGRGEGVAKGQGSFDSYVPVDNGKYRVAFAIRITHSPRSPYIAIRRKSLGRDIVEDRFALDDLALAEAFFDHCVMIVRKGAAVETFGMHDDPKVETY